MRYCFIFKITKVVGMVTAHFFNSTSFSQTLQIWGNRGNVAHISKVITGG